MKYAVHLNSRKESKVRRLNVVCGAAFSLVVSVTLFSAAAMASPTSLPSIPGVDFPGSGNSSNATAEQFNQANQAQYDENQQRLDTNGDSTNIEPIQPQGSSRTGIAGGKTETVPYLNPIEGISGHLNDQATLDLVSKVGSSKLGLYNLVVNLTEPGVAMGLTAGMNQAHGIWADRLAGEQVNDQKLARSPEGADLARQRDACLVQNAPTKGMVGSLSFCSGGDKQSQASLPGAAVSNATGKAPTMQETDPSHPRYTLPGGYPTQEFPNSPCFKLPDSVCGTDYIFNEEIRSLLQYANTVGPFQNDRRTDVKKIAEDLETARLNFINFVGDIKFSREMNDGNTQKFTSQLLPPQGAGSDSVDTVIISIQKQKYEDFNELMKMYCEWSQIICSGGALCPGGGFLRRDELIKAQYPTEAGDNNPKDVSAAVRDFWRDSIPAKPLRAQLSTTSFMMHSQIIESLYSLYKRDSAYSGKSGTGAYGPCGGFYTGTYEPANYEALHGSQPKTNVDLVNTNSAWHKPIYALSQMIGEASYLDFLGRMGALIHSRLISTSGLSTRVVLETMALLNRAAIQRSRTGSLTIEEEMYTQSKKIQEAAISMIIEPAKESTAISTSMQQQSLTGAAQSKSAPQAGEGGT